MAGLAILIGFVSLISASSSSASTYTVHQCKSSTGAGGQEAQLEGSAFGYIDSNSCGGDPSTDWLQIGTSAAAAPGAYKQWVFSAPNGTQINRAQGFYAIASNVDDKGHRAYFFYRLVGRGVDTRVQSSGGGTSTSSNFDTQYNGGPITRVGAGVICTHNANQGNCGPQGGNYARIGDVTFSMQDTVAPAQPTLRGPATAGGWLSGTKQLIFDVSDTGAGVYLTGTAVNGNAVDFDGYCSGLALDAGGTPKSLKPCPSAGTGSTDLDLNSGAFNQGDNSVLVCANEYGTNPQSGCRTITVKVDTIVPTAPTNLQVAGGEVWKRDRNNFDLSWANPAQSGTAPIVGASVKITGPSNYSSTTYYAGADRNSIDGVSVPNVVGDYTAQVYLRDAAGNETLANSSSVHLRFDDTIPAPQKPDSANGWISRSELADGYLQRWEQVNQSIVPPSGIAGYRVTVNTNSDSDPCSGAADPRACGGALTEVGSDSVTRTLHTGDLAEGANYVHVVPVSGSGMRATDVKHTPLKADFSDPVTALQGDGGGEWINHDANLLVVGSDALSGMTDTDEFPNDAPPATFMTVDGQPGSSPGNSVWKMVASEGSHSVQFWARDLAGNTAQPSSATVRVDKTAPDIAFTNKQDPTDPDKLVAPTSDALSGVVDGRISYREAGGSEWKGLDTKVEGGDLVARVDSKDLAPGTTYEFRAVATDKAGNSSTSTNRVNGEPMKVTGPFRTLTTVSGLKVNGRSNARVKYGKKAKVTGALVNQQGGASVGGASVDLVATYGLGSKKRQATKTVLTDGQGRFATQLPSGPSRTIDARYAGDEVYLGTSSAAAKLAVRGKVSLSAPKKVDSDKGITFKGKVKAKGAKIGRGKRLEVQVKVGRKWKAVDKSIRTNRKGKFKLHYRFTATYTRPVKFQFRSVVLPEKAFPYLPAKSKKRSVVVTP